MKKDSLTDIYLRRYSVGEKWKVIANKTENVSLVVVIPAYAEKEMLFSTLASLGRNNLSALESALVLCVVNNKNNSPAAVIENNQQTIGYLDHLVKKKSLSACQSDGDMHPLLTEIADAGMKLGYIDASSNGFEIAPDNGGVGTARKIGMDSALRLLKEQSVSNSVIVSLDADTLVQDNYLDVLRNYFAPDIKTAIVAYEHQMPADDLHRAAIFCYEIFLRYWVLGLRYAQSPWAFHSIGSTISVSARAYLEVRGMNKKEAGEDFYFLNKLAKVGKIDYIKETCVFPSSRPSFRVPFGTGKRIERFLTGKPEEEYRLYDPRIFSVLADWLALMQSCYFLGGEDILEKAGMIHGALKSFLEENKFDVVWAKIRRVAKNEKTLANHFHDWFDGFKTLKLINYFTRECYPQIPMFVALERIIAMLNDDRLRWNASENIPSLSEQGDILNFLRGMT
jgi:glycosyltransferase involved in cell wall biosynthesis